MSSLVSQSEMNDTAGIFQNIFETWSRNITIFKEPVKQEVFPQPTNSLFGYGPSQDVQLLNYTPVTGVFPALIRYAARFASKEKGDELQPQINEYIPDGACSIKVNADCKDFIVNGRTEKIQVDGYMFILDGVDPQTQFFWNSQYFIFNLEKKQ